LFDIRFLPFFCVILWLKCFFCQGTAKASPMELVRALI
jgi:hypothetical protein